MKIAVESGKRTPFAFENSKIKVEGSKGLFYNGNIAISKDNKVVYEGGSANLNSENSSTNDRQNSMSTNDRNCVSNDATCANSVSSPKLNKVKPETLGLDRTLAKLLSSGQKLGLADIGITDNKLVIGVDLEYISNEFEVDFSMFLLDESGKSSEENFIFYGNKVSKGMSVKIDDDLSLGINKAFNNVISLDLNKIEAGVKRISLTATLYDESKKFGDLKSGEISFITSSKKEVVNYKFTEKLSTENAIVICDLYLHNGNWKLQGVGQGFNGGLVALCSNFGVDTM